MDTYFTTSFPVLLKNLSAQCGNFHIQPNNRTVRLGKILGKLVVRYVPAKDSSNDVYVVFLCCCFFYDFLYSICCGYSFELHRQVDAIRMGPTTFVCIKK